MKKILCTIMCLMLAMYAFVACGSSSDNTISDESSDDWIYDDDTKFRQYGNEDSTIDLSIQKDNRVIRLEFTANEDENLDKYLIDLEDLTQLPDNPDAYENDLVSAVFTDDRNVLEIKALDSEAEVLTGTYHYEFVGDDGYGIPDFEGDASFGMVQSGDIKLLIDASTLDKLIRVRFISTDDKDIYNSHPEQQSDNPQLYKDKNISVYYDNDNKTIEVKALTDEGKAVEGIYKSPYKGTLQEKEELEAK